MKRTGFLGPLLIYEENMECFEYGTIVFLISISLDASTCSVNKLVGFMRKDKNTQVFISHKFFHFLII